MARKSRKSSSTASSRAAARNKRQSGSLRPARFSEEDRQRAFSLVPRGMSRKKIAEEIGCTTEALRLWLRAAEKVFAIVRVLPPSARVLDIGSSRFSRSSAPLPIEKNSP